MRKKVSIRRILGGTILLVSLSACHHDTKPAIVDNQHHPVTQAAEGQWTLVNYWAPWCEGCLREIPQLNQLAAENKVRVLGVSFDDMPEADINRFATQIHIQYALLLSDPQKSWHLPAPEVLPTSYLLDPEGRLQATLVGPQTKESVLKEIAARG